MAVAIYRGDGVRQELHPLSCQQSEADFARMRTILATDMDSLERSSAIDMGHIENELTPLLISITQGHNVCFRFLCEHGAEIDTGYKLGLDALVLAIRYKNLEIVQYLLDRGLGPNFKFLEDHDMIYAGQYQSTEYILHATSINFPPILQSLIDYGGNLEDISFIENTNRVSLITPAVNATYHGAVKSLRTLLLNGAIVDFSKERNISIDAEKAGCLSLPLQIFLSNENLQKKIEIVNLLYKFGANFLQPLEFLEKSPLEILEDRYCLSWASLVCERGEDADGVDEENYSAETCSKLAEYTQNLVCTPMSLKGLSRLAIRKQLGRRYCSDAKKLTDLPSELINYLYFPLEESSNS